MLGDKTPGRRVVAARFHSGWRALTWLLQFRRGDRCSAHHAPRAGLASMTVDHISRVMAICRACTRWNTTANVAEDANPASCSFAYSRGLKPYSKIRIAAAMTVVQRPRLSPIAVCVMLVVRTILLEIR